MKLRIIFLLIIPSIMLHTSFRDPLTSLFDDLGIENLNGKVKTITGYTKEKWKNEDIIYSFRIEYNREGKYTLFRKTDEHNNLLRQHEYIYAHGTRPVRISTFYMINNKPEKKQEVLRYNLWGQLVSNIEYDSLMIINEKQEYKRDIWGREKMYKQYSRPIINDASGKSRKGSLDLVQHITYRYRKGKLAKQTELDPRRHVKTHEHSYNYDRNGKLVEKIVVIHEKSGDSLKLVAHPEFTAKYDAAGNMIESTEYDFDGTIRKKITYTWENGKLAERREKKRSFSTVYKFDRFGNITWKSYLYEGKEGKSDKVNEGTYVFDKQNNWIMRYMLSDGDTVLKQERVIEYYE